MKYFKFIIIILIILFKTGNDLYAESIFTVNNIQVNKNSFKNKEELINIAFRKGFEKLNNKILLEKDYLKTRNISLRIIKNLVSHYQIIKNDDENVKNFLYEKYPECEFDVINNTGSEHLIDFRREGWNHIVFYKMKAIHKTLQKYDRVLFTDGDIVFYSNPLFDATV